MQFNGYRMPMDSPASNSDEPRRRVVVTLREHEAPLALMPDPDALAAVYDLPDGFRVVEVCDGTTRRGMMVELRAFDYIIEHWSFPAIPQDRDLPRLERRQPLSFAEREATETLVAIARAR